MNCLKNISTVCLLTFVSIATFAQTAVTAHEFSIQQCIDYAKKNNVQVKNALLDYQIQQQDNRAITSQALPLVTANAGLTDYLKIPTTLLPGEFFSQPAGTYIPVKFGTKYNANGGITLQQTIFDGQVFIGLKARQTSLDYRLKNVDITDEAIRVNVYKVYYQLVVSKTQIDQLDANIDRTKNLLHVYTEMYKNGFAEKISVDRTNVQLANIQTEKEKVLSSVKNGYLGLKLLMGMPVQDSLVLTDQITEDEIKQGLLSEGLYKYTDRNDYQYLELGKKLSDFNVKRYKLSYIPVVSLTGNYSKQAQRTKFDIFGKGDWFSTSYLGLNIAIPIFDGFQKDANIKKARLQGMQIQNQLDNLKISIDNDVQQATNSFRTAVSTLDYQKKNMQLAEQVYNQAQKKYEAGTGATIDITDAQSELRIAQSNYVSAMYDAVIARVDYLKAIGKL